MPVQMLIIPVVLPILSGALIPVFRFKKDAAREAWMLIWLLINLALIFALALNRPEDYVICLAPVPGLEIALHLDGPAVVFACQLALFWLLGALYAFEYMRREKKKNGFYAWFMIACGVALGVAFSANLFTLYVFYVMLTLATLPLLMYTSDLRATHAGKKYLLYSITGAACVFIAIMLITNITGSDLFLYGGMFRSLETIPEKAAAILPGAFLLAFFGFGVNALVWPLHGWLPTACAAPTPVTALLHAAAVPMAGAFGIMRVIYYIIGTDTLSSNVYGTKLLGGPWAQQVAIIFVLITIVYGSVMAVKEQHLKRRLAYCAIGSLSGSLLGFLLMTPQGLRAGRMHLLFHGIIIIGLFFAAGALLCHHKIEYISRVRGCGRKMPVLFTCFTISALALIGVPLFCGFVSKYELSLAAIGSGNLLASVGVGALILSAFLLAVALMGVIIPAFVPGRDFDHRSIARVKDPGWRMKVSLLIPAAVVIFFGLFASPLKALL